MDTVNDSGGGQRRPWSDCADAQADLGLCCQYMPEDILAWHGPTVGGLKSGRSIILEHNLQDKPRIHMYILLGSNFCTEKICGYWQELHRQEA